MERNNTLIYIILVHIRLHIFFVNDHAVVLHSKIGGALAISSPLSTKYNTIPTKIVKYTRGFFSIIYYYLNIIL